ncbi:hypothetical protein V1512DRAFT_260519 [Lipomyces arxii]|uniref:uncharacterized protein n=1 Tax=Lipomyces arxii TaxID=56418 RepID=UPI0034D02124
MFNLTPFNLQKRVASEVPVGTLPRAEAKLQRQAVPDLLHHPDCVVDVFNMQITVKLTATNWRELVEHDTCCIPRSILAARQKANAVVEQQYEIKFEWASMMDHYAYLLDHVDQKCDMELVAAADRVIASAIEKARAEIKNAIADAAERCLVASMNENLTKNSNTEMSFDSEKEAYKNLLLEFDNVDIAHENDQDDDEATLDAQTMYIAEPMVYSRSFSSNSSDKYLPPQSKPKLYPHRWLPLSLATEVVPLTCSSDSEDEARAKLAEKN